MEGLAHKPPLFVIPALAAWEQRPEILTHTDVEWSGTVGGGIGLSGQCFGGLQARPVSELHAKEGSSPARGLELEEEVGPAL